MSSCEKHQHEHGVALCRRCGGVWCKNCLVYTYGPKKPPYCVSCAMYAGGVRTSAPRPAVTKRELKALERQFKAVAAASAVAPVPADVTAETADAEMAEVGARAGGGSGLPASDWSTPWWEEQ